MQNLKKIVVIIKWDDEDQHLAQFLIYFKHLVNTNPYYFNC